MDSVFQWTTGSLYIIVPGLIYLVVAFFLILIAIGKFDLTFIKSMNNYLTFIFILILIFSYILGLSCQIVLEKIIWLIHDSSEKTFDNIIKHLDNQGKPYSDLEIFSLSVSYSKLLMFRHLVISFFLLFIALSVWLNNYESKNLKIKWFALSCIFFENFFLIIYFLQRDIHLKLLHNFVK